MKFEKDPGYLEGDVIVAGKTTRITDGLIRKVVQVKKATDGYWVETEEASLADVFEKVHVIRHFVYTKKSVSESENLSGEENGQDGEYAFQTSFEELLFRGYLMQWSALLFKYRWVAVVITGVLFGILHGANPEVEEFGMWVALPQYILMGLILGFVAVKDDGMELSLGLHMANNIIAAITITSDSSTLQTHALFKDLHPTASHFDTLTMLVAGVIFIWICNRKYHFWGKICLWKKIQKESNEM